MVAPHWSALLAHQPPAVPSSPRASSMWKACWSTGSSGGCTCESCSRRRRWAGLFQAAPHSSAALERRPDGMYWSRGGLPGTMFRPAAPLWCTTGAAPTFLPAALAHLLLLCCNCHALQANQFAGKEQLDALAAHSQEFVKVIAGLPPHLRALGGAPCTGRGQPAATRAVCVHTPGCGAAPATLHSIPHHLACLAGQRRSPAQTHRSTRFSLLRPRRSSGQPAMCARSCSTCS